MSDQQMERTSEPRKKAHHLASVEYDERFLDASWAWFQDPELRRLTETPPVTRAAQRAWYASLPSRQDYFVWGVELGGTPIAVFGLKDVTPDDSAEAFLFIGEADKRGLGIGDWLEYEIVRKAASLGLHRVWVRVRIDNEASVRLHRKHGFSLDREDGNGRLYMSRGI